MGSSLTTRYCLVDKLSEPKALVKNGNHSAWWLYSIPILIHHSRWVASLQLIPCCIWRLSGWSGSRLLRRVVWVIIISYCSELFYSTCLLPPNVFLCSLRLPIMPPLITPNTCIVSLSACVLCGFRFVRSHFLRAPYPLNLFFNVFILM